MGPCRHVKTIIFKVAEYLKKKKKETKESIEYKSNANMLQVMQRFPIEGNLSTKNRNNKIKKG